MNGSYVPLATRAADATSTVAVNTSAADSQATYARRGAAPGRSPSSRRFPASQGTIGTDATTPTRTASTTSVCRYEAGGWSRAVPAPRPNIDPRWTIAADIVFARNGT